MRKCKNKDTYTGNGLSMTLEYLRSTHNTSQNCLLKGKESGHLFSGSVAHWFSAAFGDIITLLDFGLQLYTSWEAQVFRQGPERCGAWVW